MSLHSKSLCFVLCIWVLIEKETTIFANGSAVNQACPSTVRYREFFCPSTGTCRNGNDRCQIPKSNQCWAKNSEPECRYESNGQFRFCRGWTHLDLSGRLSGSLSRKRRDTRDWKFQHEFVSYRGFTYEFGSDYGENGQDGYRILDEADPNFRYDDLETDCAISNGLSKCSWDDIKIFLYNYDTKYRLLYNNCQTFARLLEETLRSSNCRLPPRQRRATCPTVIVGETSLGIKEAASVLVLLANFVVFLLLC
eukprot:m.307935 g.307935  ORF g.307935 m.307935 type:complete len:252 (+) comp43044_c0_seq1:74-829(+)